MDALTRGRSASRHLAAVAALLALPAPIQAAVQTCPMPLGNDTGATLRIDDRGRTIDALGIDLVQLVGGSAHECSLGARRGDGRSRWRKDGTATFVTTNGAAGPFEAAVQRHGGDLLLSVSAPGGEPATCGTIAVPGTVIVTPGPSGRCFARLPGQRPAR